MSLASMMKLQTLWILDGQPDHPATAAQESRSLSKIWQSAQPSLRVPFRMTSKDFTDVRDVVARDRATARGVRGDDLLHHGLTNCIAGHRPPPISVLAHSSRSTRPV